MNYSTYVCVYVCMYIGGSNCIRVSSSINTLIIQFVIAKITNNMYTYSYIRLPSVIKYQVQFINFIFRIILCISGTCRVSNQILFSSALLTFLVSPRILIPLTSPPHRFPTEYLNFSTIYSEITRFVLPMPTNQLISMQFIRMFHTIIWFFGAADLSFS